MAANPVLQLRNGNGRVDPFEHDDINQLRDKKDEQCFS